MVQTELFTLPELDRKKTQAAVEAALEKYRLYKTITFDEREASVTAGYSDMPRSYTGTTTDQTAQIATHNVDVPNMRRAYCERLEKVVKRLHPKERVIIEARYMREEYVRDYAVYNHICNPPMSDKTYDKYRRNAFYKIALAMDIAVEKGK